jgi:hypothetical protein
MLASLTPDKSDPSLPVKECSNTQEGKKKKNP